MYEIVITLLRNKSIIIHKYNVTKFQLDSDYLYLVVGKTYLTYSLDELISLRIKKYD